MRQKAIAASGWRAASRALSSAERQAPATAASALMVARGLLAAATGLVAAQTVLVKDARLARINPRTGVRMLHSPEVKNGTAQITDLFSKSSAACWDLRAAGVEPASDVWTWQAGVVVAAARQQDAGLHLPGSGLTAELGRQLPVSSWFWLWLWPWVLPQQAVAVGMQRRAHALSPSPQNPQRGARVLSGSWTDRSRAVLDWSQVQQRAWSRPSADWAVTDVYGPRPLCPRWLLTAVAVAVVATPQDGSLVCAQAGWHLPWQSWAGVAEVGA